MITKFSKRLTIWLVKKKVASIDDIELYQYGINRFLNTTLVYVTTFALGIIFDQFFQSIIFLISFIKLRSYSGGFHANSSIKCYFLTIITVISSLLVNRFVSLDRFIWFGLLIVFGIIILQLSPIGTSNKPLDDIERIIYKRKTIIVWCFECLVAVFFLLVNNQIFISIVFSHFITSLSLICEKARCSTITDKV